MFRSISRLAFLAVFSFFASVSGGLADNGVRASFGGVSLYLPQPGDLCPVEDKGGANSLLYKHTRDLQQQAGNKLFAIWADCPSLAAMNDGSLRDSLKNWVIIVGGMSGTPRSEVTFPDATREQFIELMLQAYPGIDLSNIEEQIDLEGINERYLGNPGAVSFGEMESLGVLAITDSVHAGIISRVGSSDSSGDNLVLNISGSTLINGVIVHVYHYALYESKNSIDSLLSDSKYYSALLVNRN